MRRDTAGVKTMFDALRLRDVDTVTTHPACVTMRHDESRSVTKMLGASSPREDVIRDVSGRWSNDACDTKPV